MKKIIISRLVVLFSLLNLFGCATKQPPVDAEGRPLIEKIGTVDCDMVETTPVVFKDKVYCF
jgi:hypothetical protein